MARRRKRKGGLGNVFIALILMSVPFALLKDHPIGKVFLPLLLLILMLAVIMIVIKLVIKGIEKLPTSSPKPRFAPRTIAIGSHEPMIGNTREETDLYPLWKSPNKTPSSNLSPDRWSLNLLTQLEWKRFEEVAAEYYRIQGFDAKTTRIGPDGGIDIILRKQGINTPIAVIQCKAHKNNIGVKPIRELYGVMAAEKVERGVFITTSDYTSEARQFAREKKLLLLSGKDFIEKVDQLDDEQKGALLIFATRGDYLTPTCPRCDIKMIIKRRHKDNEEFWGCPNYRPYGKGCSQIFNIRK